MACSAFGTIFILVKLFPTLTDVLGQHGTYFGFAIVCVLMAFFTQAFVPGLQSKIFKPGELKNFVKVGRENRLKVHL